MKAAHIIYYNYLTPDGSQMSIGGIQTYITNLIGVFKDLGMKVCIYQKADNDFQKEVNGAEVFGKHYDCKHQRLLKNICSFVKTRADKANDLIIFACDTCIVDCEGYNTIAVQHGITWDKPQGITASSMQYIKTYLKMRYYAWLQIKRIEKVKKLVCVDYNFNNWYRAEVPYPKIKTEVIPNFCAIPSEKPEKPCDNISIIFARRFFTYRGTRIFASAVSRILNKYKNINILVAGEGPDEKYMKDSLSDFFNVQFTKYSSTDSLKIHADKHIAVIPTIGSEGTSLSLLEAMASGCAVIATNVGGMTNIVLDQYNGILINPVEEELYASLEKLILNDDYRNILAENAYATVKKSFSLDLWKNRWKEIVTK